MTTEVLVHRAVTRTEAATLRATKTPYHPPQDVPEGPWQARDADTGELVLRVLTAPDQQVAGMTDAFRRIERSTVMRAAGIRSRSNTFGYAAPSGVLRRNTPATSAWAIRDPEGHYELELFAEWAWPQLLAGLDGAQVDLMDDTRQNVHPDWRIGDSGWTSGIANDTVPLYYHTDANNVRHAWSAMLASRAGVKGGDLHVADYGITVPIRHGDVICFPGVDLMHGVTPMRPTLTGGYRYTFVFYPVRRFTGLPGSTEARAAAARRRTELEHTLIARQHQTGHLR